MKTAEQKAAHAAYMRGWYSRNPEASERRRKVSRNWRVKNPERVRAISRRQREEKAAVVIAAKACPCVDCGQQYDHPAMHLDHVRGNKVRSVGNGRNFSSLTALRAEITKCDVRCAVCHALRHHNEEAI